METEDDKLEEEPEEGFLEKIGSKRINYQRKIPLNKYARLRAKKTYRNGQSKALYPEYITSDAWRARRKLYFETHAHRCVICYATTNITLHHLSYRHLGNELDRELVALCRPHHLEYHKLNGVVTEMTRSTNAYIKTKRAEIQEAKSEKDSREEAEGETMGTLQADNS